MTQLAQGLEAAEKGLTLLERIQAGGIPLLCLVLSVVCGWMFYRQMRANQQIREEQVRLAEQREETAKAEAAQRMAEQEKLLREMLERDRDAQEAHQAATLAVEGFTQAVQDTAHQMGNVSRRVEDLERVIRRTHGPA